MLDKIKKFEEDYKNIPALNTTNAYVRELEESKVLFPMLDLLQEIIETNDSEAFGHLLEAQIRCGLLPKYNGVKGASKKSRLKMMVGMQPLVVSEHSITVKHSDCKIDFGFMFGLSYPTKNNALYQVSKMKLSEQLRSFDPSDKKLYDVFKPFFGAAGGNTPYYGTGPTLNFNDYGIQYCNGAVLCCIKAQYIKTLNEGTETERKIYENSGLEKGGFMWIKGKKAFEPAKLDFFMDVLPKNKSKFLLEKTYNYLEIDRLIDLLEQLEYFKCTYIYENNTPSPVLLDFGTDKVPVNSHYLKNLLLIQNCNSAITGKGLTIALNQSVPKTGWKVMLIAPDMDKFLAKEGSGALQMPIGYSSPTFTIDMQTLEIKITPTKTDKVFWKEYEH